MIKLNDFDKHKLKGFAYAAEENYFESLESFKNALKIKEDAQIYYQIAFDLVYLRQYKDAQEYALKAIEHGYDAYELYSKITVGNLANIDKAVEVLISGVEKKISSACIALAYLHYDNNLNPDMKDPYQASYYLELAYKYAKESDKCLYAYRVSQLYYSLVKTYPYIKEEMGHKPLEYMTIFNNYGASLGPVGHINLTLFDQAILTDDHSVVDILFERFDSNAELLFAMMLLEEEYKTFKKQSNTINGLPYILIKDAAKRHDNFAAQLICAYQNITNQEILKKYYDKVKAVNLFIPNYYKDAFDAFIKCFEELLVVTNEA